MQSSGIWATPLAKKIIKERNIRIETIIPSGRSGEIKARDVCKQPGVKYTPMAQKLANQFSVELSAIGGGKRIRKSDVLQYLQDHKAAKNTGPADNGRLVLLPAIKRVTGEKMSRAHAEIPPVTMNIQADVTELLLERAKINATDGVKLSVNDYVIHACARALAATPSANASFSPDGIIYKADINIGIAVALENGLIVPVIKKADTLIIEQISVQMKELACRARMGTLSIDDCTGGTFTISNLGMYGITSFTPIINMPESLILGVCAIEKRLILDNDGSLKNRDFMGLSLTFDHRVHDGAQAAIFLKKIVDELELKGKSK